MVVATSMVGKRRTELEVLDFADLLMFFYSRSMIKSRQGAANNLVRTATELLLLNSQGVRK